MNKRRPGRTLEARTDFNLNEIHKEIIRVRCAMEEKMMDSYLERRLGKRLFGQISAVIDRWVLPSADIEARARPAGLGRLTAPARR